DFLALVRHLDLILGFLLLRVVGLQGEEIGARGESDPPVFLVGKDRRALQRLTQVFAVRLHGLRRIARDYTRELWETTIDQLRTEANFAYLGPTVVSSDCQLDSVLGPEDPLQLQQAFA